MKAHREKLASLLGAVAWAVICVLTGLALLLSFADLSHADGGWRIETVTHGVKPYQQQNHDSRIAIGPDGSVHIVAASTWGWDFPLLYAHRTSGSWSVERVSSGFVGGLGVDSQGNVHTAYSPMYYPPFKRDGTHYAVRTPGGWSDNWIEGLGGSPSLIVDRSDTVRVATFLTVSVSPSISALRLASRLGGTWVMSDVLLPEVVMPDFFPTLATAVDSNGWGYIACFFATPSGDSAVAELQLATQTAAGWAITTIDTVSEHTLTFDNILDMAIDGDDHLHIVYWDATNYSTDGPYVKYATNTSGVWTTSILVQNALYPAVAVDRSNKVHVVYNTYLGDLEYLSNVSGVWDKSTIKIGTGPDDILSDIAVDDTGRVHVSYYDPDVGLLKYAVYPVMGVSIDKIAPGQAMPTETISYSVTVTNHGPNAATSVMVTDVIPGDVTLISASASQGACGGVGTVTCDIGSLAVGASVAITIGVKVNATAPDQICNTASVSASGDPDSSDNTSTACTTIARATVSITATDPVAKEDGPKAGLLTVSRNGNPGNSLIVKYSVSGTATPGTDYEELPGTVEIKAGMTTAPILVIPRDDALIEGNETVTVTLSPDPSYIVGSSYSATVTIQDHVGGTFIPSDLAGTWYVQAFGDSHSPSANNPRWRSCTMIVNMVGVLTGGACDHDPGSGAMITGGALASDSVGQVSGSLTLSNGTTVSFQHGKLDASKTLLTLVSSSSDFREIFVASKGGGTFAPSDLAGTWYIQGFGDSLLGNHPSWSWGTVIVNPAGVVTGGTLASFWDVTALAITGGALASEGVGQVSGSLALSNGTTVSFQHGKLDASKTLLTLVSSAADFRELFVASKGGGTFAPSDLAGTWYIQALEDNPFLNSPGWSSGTMIVDSWGNLIGGNVINDHAEITTFTGSFTIQTSGEVSGLMTTSNGGGVMFPHGKLDASKGLLTLVRSSIPESLGLFVAIKGGANRGAPPPVILWRNTVTGANAVWYMDGVTLSGIADLPALPNAAYAIVGKGDFNGDGKTDILWRNMVTGANAVWYMDGVTLIGIADLPALPNASYSIVGTGDFNGDGKPDILWRNTVTGANAVWYMDGVAITGIADLPALPNASYSIVGTGDFNGDGKPDILWRNTVTGANAVWYMNGVTLSGIADLPALPNAAYAIVGTGDFNGDGKPDILWRNTTTGSNAVWYMDGVAITGIADLPPLPNPDYAIVGR
jgi:uncharacterized repeat protein (TIGR01451 family)